MLTVCSINIMFYNNKWKFSEKAAAVSLFQSEKSADINAFHKNSLEFIKIFVSIYFQAGTSVTLIRALKILCVILPWSGTDVWQVISRVHHLSKTGLSFLIKLFSFNAIFNIVNINHQAKWILLITYNNKYVKNKDVVDLTNLRNDKLSEENDFDEVDDRIWEIKICERLKVLTLNCSMFYFESSFKDLYYTANHDVFLICFCLSTKVEGYNVNDTHI